MSETISGDGPYEFDKPIAEVTDVRDTDDGIEIDYRSAETGKFVSEAYAAEHPDTTVRETTDEENDAKMDAEVKTFDDLKRVRLSRRRVVMKRHPEQKTGDYVYFEADTDDEPAIRTDGYYMTVENWEAFGSPEHITVGVVNGDILN